MIATKYKATKNIPFIFLVANLLKFLAVTLVFVVFILQLPEKIQDGMQGGQGMGEVTAVAARLKKLLKCYLPPFFAVLSRILLQPWDLFSLLPFTTPLSPLGGKSSARF